MGKKKKKEQKKPPLSSPDRACLYYIQKRVSQFLDKRMDIICTQCQGCYWSQFLGSTIFSLFHTQVHMIPSNKPR